MRGALGVLCGVAVGLAGCGADPGSNRSPEAEAAMERTFALLADGDVEACAGLTPRAQDALATVFRRSTCEDSVRAAGRFSGQRPRVTGFLRNPKVFLSDDPWSPPPATADRATVRLIAPLEGASRVRVDVSRVRDGARGWQLDAGIPLIFER